MDRCRYIDYQVLNKVIVKNKYSIPLIADLFDRLGQDKYFTKVDLRKGNYQFVVVYLDDIVIYNNTLEEHMDHLRKVFQVLRENELHIKREKSEFAQSKVHFLGHVIRNGELRMDEAKVRAIQEWEEPIKVTELRYFLSLSNYYRRFISGCSAKTAPLTGLLKKNKPWIWTEHYQKAFEGLKVAVTEEPVLALPDFAKTFDMHTNASDFPIGVS
ncbi:uncharacterized mitochondrial protein AtMg00860-like [Nicotiana sylvestris]|uniref:uncharacterized mitochondrial protein AtMg00860-like n=1 Tax=Nicotiana sylvestris TaxID=4096 RepID=UPI00388CC990